ncbi:hypothetical protein CPC08DRAFT_706252 [Agrocybe pediades]|nr:hypothetical protein CPC08DRAFT_706252 [Agrocybe pediades]
MSRRVADSGAALPSNPEYIDWRNSDGNVSTWPTATSRIIDNEGHVNYFEHVQSNHYQSIRWRTTVGDAVAKSMNMPEGKNYVMRDFPQGYRLFDHNKGPANNPRHDLYLFGAPKKRFRSIFEFVPHAIWLMSDLSGNCACKYCGGKKSQKEITASISNILRLTPNPSPSSTRPKPPRDKDKGKAKEVLKREPRRRETRVYAAVQKTVKHLKPSAGVLKQPMLVERNSDLRAMYCPTSMDLKRWYREGEIVWCALEFPIPGLGGNKAGSIEFWPGVVDEVKLRTVPIPRPTGENSDTTQTEERPGPSTVEPPPDPAGQDAKGPILENDTEPLPWTIRQSTLYKVQLLAINHSYTIEDAQVIPYQAYVPPDDLINAMVTVPSKTVDFEKERLSKFNPCIGKDTPSFAAAVPAYATALQIASILSSTWCLTDEYDVKYSITPSPKPSPKASTSALPPTQPTPRSASQPPLSLAEAIQAASRHNDQVASSISSYRPVSSTHPDMPPAEVDSTVARLLGAPPSNLVQTRFQGLWWGVERIWTNDFIRLKIPRRTLAPKGGPHILPPSGPGKSVAETWKSLDRDPAQLGAGVRGIFLRLDSLITVDVPAKDGSLKKEARVCGMLYELADEDWEDPSEATPKATDAVQTGPPDISAPVLSTADPSAAGSALPNVPPTPVPQNSKPLDTADNPLGNLLPEAPKGYKFRPILTPGFEFVGAMGLISGRYYPRVLDHPRIKPRVEAALDLACSGAPLGCDNLWALEGLSGGYFNSVDPYRYKPNRVAMMQDADAEAVAQLQRYVATKAAVRDDAMDVDDPFM